MSPDTVFVSQRDWWRPQALFPAGQSPTTSFGSCGGGTAASPMCVHTYVNGNTVFTQGGLITASAAGVGVVGVNGVTALAPANALRGIQFGPNGTADAVQFRHDVREQLHQLFGDRVRRQLSVFHDCAALSQHDIVRICEL